MAISSTNGFVGLPFSFHGRDFKGVDCYGLVWLWHKEVRGIELPDFRNEYRDAPSQSELANAFERGRQEGSWRTTGTPEVGDVIFLRAAGLPSHCGLVVGKERFLHVCGHHPSRIEYWTNPIWRDRVLGFYRYHGAGA